MGISFALSPDKPIPTTLVGGAVADIDIRPLLDSYEGVIVC